MKLVLDSGAVSHLAQRSPGAAALTRELRANGVWPPVVPTIVLVECLSGRAGADAKANQFLKSCDVVPDVPAALARRCAALRHQARSDSAVDAVTVGLAEPNGVVLTSDPEDLNALAAGATGVTIRLV